MGRYFRVALTAIVVTVVTLLCQSPLQQIARAGTPPNILDDSRGDVATAALVNAAITPPLDLLLSPFPTIALPPGPVLGLTPHGRVLAHPHIVNLYYSHDWDAERGSAPSKEQIQAFTGDLVSSGYFDRADQYGVGSASFDSSIFEDKGGSKTFCGTWVNSTTDFTQLVLWVSCEVGAGRAANPFDLTLTGVPGPNKNSLYVVYLPPGTTYNATPLGPRQSCDAFGGYHFFSAAAAHKFGVPVPQSFSFAVVRAGCAGTFDGLMGEASHEIIEAATDPIDFLGWFNLLPITSSDVSSLGALFGGSGPFGGLALDAKAGEAADICQNVGSPVTGSPAYQHPTPPVQIAVADPALANGGHITVEPYWSNADNGCVPAAPTSSLSTGSPSMEEGGSTWVTSSTGLTLRADTPSGFSGDGVEIDARAWRTGTSAPAMSACGSGTGTASCSLHLDANDGADGTYTLEFRAVDTTTGAREATHTATFQLDNTAPTTTASLTGAFERGWYRTSVGVTLSAGDGAGVGVDGTRSAVDGGAPSAYSGEFLVSGDSSSHTVTFSSVDKLGNAEATRSTTFKIDGTPPDLSVGSASDGRFSYTENELLGGILTDATSLSLTYAASDALSGLYEVRLDGATLPPSGTVSLPLLAGISSHALVAEDVAGNETRVPFQVVSVPPGTFSGGVDPRGPGFWEHAVSNGSYSATDIARLLEETDLVSEAFGATIDGYANVTLANYLDDLAAARGPDMNPKVRRELLVAWLNLVSGREPTGQVIDVRSVRDWETVITDTGGSSRTTALNLVREVELRLAHGPSSAELETCKNLLEELSSGHLNR